MTPDWCSPRAILVPARGACEQPLGARKGKSDRADPRSAAGLIAETPKRSLEVISYRQTLGALRADLSPSINGPPTPLSDRFEIGCPEPINP